MLDKLKKNKSKFTNLMSIPAIAVLTLAAIGLTAADLMSSSGNQEALASGQGSSSGLNGCIRVLMAEGLSGAQAAQDCVPNLLPLNK